MHHLGFDGYALDYVDCPEGLKWFLRRECNFHRNVRDFASRPIRHLSLCIRAEYVLIGYCFESWPR